MMIVICLDVDTDREKKKITVMNFSEEIVLGNLVIMTFFYTIFVQRKFLNEHLQSIHFLHA